MESWIRRAVTPANEGKEVDIIEGWAHIEADFQREYRIDLVSELDKMSWRKFLVLLRNLSGDSVFVYQNREEESDGTQIIDDDDLADQAVISAFGISK